MKEFSHMTPHRYPLWIQMEKYRSNESEFMDILKNTNCPGKYCLLQNHSGDLTLEN